MQPADIISFLNGIVGTYPDAGNSASGYYITDQKDGIPVKFVSGGAGSMSVGDILNNAISDGSRNFLTDFAAEFSNRYTPMYPDHNGYIGKRDRSNAITTGVRSRAVVSWKSYSVDATCVISEIQLFSSVTADVVVDVYHDSDLETAIGSVTVECEAGKWAKAVFENPILVDLSDRDLSNDERSGIIFTWEIPDGGTVRANKVSCCGRVPQFKEFIEVGAYTVNDLSEMEENARTAKRHGAVGLGLSVNASIGCTFGSFLTNLSYNIFNAQGWQWILAKCLQHGAVMNLADTFIHSQAINQYTLLSREVVYGKRSHAESEYRKCIKWLVQNMPEGATGCFTCRQSKYAMGEILV